MSNLPRIYTEFIENFLRIYWKFSEQLIYNLLENLQIIYKVIYREFIENLTSNLLRIYYEFME